MLTGKATKVGGGRGKLFSTVLKALVEKDEKWTFNLEHAEKAFFRVNHNKVFVLDDVTNEPVELKTYKAKLFALMRTFLQSKMEDDEE